MRAFTLLVVLCTLSEPVVAQTRPVPARSSDEAECMAFIALEQNYRVAHENERCLAAAKAGFGPAQYAVGMGYGFGGDRVSEERYYRLAADQRIVAAYLALGHTFAETKPWESVYWYQRFIATKPEGYGYAALLVSKIFVRLQDAGQAAYWLEVCRESKYEGCQ